MIQRPEAAPSLLPGRHRWRAPLAIRCAGGALLVGLLLAAEQAEAAEVTVDTSGRHQTIEGWGTCMITWSLAQTPYQDPAWREAYRDLGLNILRMNMNKNVLVDGSGDMSVPVVLGGDLAANVSQMDFTTSAVQVFGDMASWLAQNALEPERVRIVGSVWSPPHWMKGPTGATQHHVSNPGVEHLTPWLSSGTTGDSIGGRLLQTPQNLEQFGRYVASWVTGFEQQYGVPLYAMSIQNEISFENPFDSATYERGPNGESNQHWQYADALAAVKTEFEASSITTRIKGPHMASVGVSPDNPWALWHQVLFIEAVKDHADSTLIDFVDFYGSNGYMDTSEGAVQAWAGYLQGQDAVDANWANWVDVPGIINDGKPVWISEVGGAEAAWLDGAGGTPGGGAITVAQKMHNALVHANASAYVYWQMSDTNDEETVHILLGKSHVSDPHSSNKYVAFKHYSRYVRPGASRVDASFENGNSSIGGSGEHDTYHSLNVSAFVHDQDHTVTVVLVNMTAADEPIDLQLPSELEVTSLQQFVSSNDGGFQTGADVAVTAGAASLTAPAYGVVTLHGATAGSGGAGGGGTGGSAAGGSSTGGSSTGGSGASSATPDGAVDDSDGCGCTLPPSRGDGLAWLAAALVAALGGLQRRRAGTPQARPASRLAHPGLRGHDPA